eukprot:SAG11_NODE_2237_length_3650_cov_49.920867_4_plen_33_part_00
MKIELAIQKAGKDLAKLMARPGVRVTAGATWR